MSSPFLLSPRSSQSPAASNKNKRQLIRPTSHIPWSVDVVSAVPGPVSEILDQALSGATYQNWACLVFPKGFVYIWQSHSTSNLAESLQRPGKYAKLYLPDLEGTSKTNRPLVALSSPHGIDTKDSIHLYILHPSSGCVILKKVTRRDMGPTSMGNYTARVRIPMEIDDLVEDDQDNQPPLRFTALTCHNSMAVAGTSRGDLYWITHIAVPVGLHVQKVQAPDTSGFFSRIFGSASTTSRGSISNETNETIILPLGDANEFLAISISSGVVKWRAEQPIASGHNAIFSPISLGTFGKIDNDWTVREILKAVVSSDSRHFHCIVRGSLDETNESRLFWVVLRLGETNISILRSHWLSRFALPDQVRVLGLVACENDSVYAAMTTAVNEAVIVMALVPGGDGDRNDHIVQEVDLPMREVPDLLPSMMERDTVTHGCYMVASSGIGMRARYMPQHSGHQQQQSPTKRRKIGNDKILAQHLRSHFWASYQDPNVGKPTPPSLLQGDSSDLEAAIIQIGAELQQKGDPSSYSISLEWQSSFIKLLQDDGLYRRLSEDGKWKLLGIGQELNTFGNMSQMLLQHKHSYRDQELIDTCHASLESQNMAEWFLSVQQRMEDSGWLHSELWYDLLGNALENILGFREQFSQTVYDVSSERSHSALWISQEPMKEMLMRQIKYWEKNYHPESVPLSLIEAVVKVSLLSYSESTIDSQSAEKASRDLVRMQKTAISFLRHVSNGKDELAFELSIQYHYFDGLCELSVAHEKKRDAASYALDPLFETIEGRDSKTGYSFAHHVLQWHTDKGLYGQVINYGRHSLSDLNRIMEKNPQLRQYRWIPSIRQGYFGQATSLFLENCKEDNGLANNQWALSMARLTNKLVPLQSQQATEQGKAIERSLELIEAQRRLTESKSKDNCPVLPPEELVELAIRRLEDCFDEDERVNLAFIGLSVCNYLNESTSIFQEHKSRIWAECLLANGAKWNEWAQQGAGSSAADLEWLKEDALSSTVFGRVLEECRKEYDSMKDVTYGRHMEKEVVDRVQGEDNRESFVRVLRTVADSVAAESIQVDSLMVSTY